MSDGLLEPFLGGLDDDELPPDPTAAKLGAAVLEMLKVGTERKTECERAVRFQFAAARHSINNRMPAPQEIREAAHALGVSLRKAKTAMGTLNAVLASLCADNGLDLRLAARQIGTLIEMSDSIERGVVVPKASKPRNVAKHASKMAARLLISEFGDGRNRTDRSAARRENAVARLFVKALTGKPAGDLRGDLEDFAKPLRIRILRAKNKSRKLSTNH